MKKCFLIFTAIYLLSLSAFANVVKPALSVICTAPGQSISEFSFDLYSTGHPMGGDTMFTGMFEVASDNIHCFKGHIFTLRPKDGKSQFRGSLNCASSYELNLIVDTLLFNKGVPYTAIVSYKEVMPLGGERWINQPVECTQQ